MNERYWVLGVGLWLFAACMWISQLINIPVWEWFDGGFRGGFMKQASSFRLGHPRLATWSLQPLAVSFEKYEVNTNLIYR